MPASPNASLVLQVLVTRRRDRGGAANQGSVARLPEEARLVALKSRTTS
jgi:hypothetical protein